MVDSPSQLAAVRSEQELVAEAMRNIPVELQITLELFYWEELKVAETAAATDVAVGTVKSRLSRGRAMLKQWLERQESITAALRDAGVAVVASMA